ncbi:MAG: phosphatase domain-containing protein [Bacteriovoracia bacterium]
MKNLLIVALFFSFNSFAGISIISDLDDTIKVTHSDDFTDSFGYGTSRRKVYLGMPELLEESRQYVNEVSVVTASPRILRFNVNRLLKKNKIKADRVVLNGNIRRPGHVEFKVKAIKKIMDSTTDQYILLGDDVGNDPEIYDEIIKLYPGRVLGSYIHVVNNRTVPESSITYFTTFELAVKEFLAGRLSKESVSRVSNAIMKEKDLEAVFPEFAHCPKDASPYAWLSKTDFASEASMLTEKLVTYCKTEWEEED